MYQFIKSEIDEGTYSFKNLFGDNYEIYFVKTPYYFQEYNLFNDNVFELVIKLIEFNDTFKKKPALDPHIPPTIAAIFLDFFQNHEKVVVFSCDTSDRKQAVRNRKFDSWFLQFNDNTFIKLNGVIEDYDNEIQYFMSLIMKNNNPLKVEIIEAFEELTQGLSDAK